MAGCGRARKIGGLADCAIHERRLCELTVAENGAMLLWDFMTVAWPGSSVSR